MRLGPRLEPGKESYQRHGKQKETSADGGNRDDPGEILHQRGGGSVSRRLERLLLDQTLVLCGPFIAQILAALPARKNHRIHRKMSRPKVRVEEVDHENKPDRQQRFFTMGNQDDIEQVARQNGKRGANHIT